MRLSRPSSRLSILPPAVAQLPVAPADREQRRDAMNPLRALYKTARWRALRMLILRRDRFTCQWKGCGRVEADTSQLVCDHRKPHRGDERLFWDTTNLQTLCKPCHDGPKARAEAAARMGRG